MDDFFICRVCGAECYEHEWCAECHNCLEHCECRHVEDGDVARLSQWVETGE